MKKNTFILSICLVIVSPWVTQCSLEDGQDLGESCLNVTSITLGSGSSCTENTCTDCGEEDQKTCDSYRNQGVFTLQRCPHDFVCNVADDAENRGSVCAHQKSQEQDLGTQCLNVTSVLLGSGGICHEAECDQCNDEDLKTCESYRNQGVFAYQHCPHDFTCAIAEHGEESENTCIHIQTSRCDEGFVFLCNDRCASSCDKCESNENCYINLTLYDTLPDEAVCTPGQYQCSESLELQVCSGGQWLGYETCQYGCENNRCADEPDSGGDGGDNTGGDPDSETDPTPEPGGDDTPAPEKVCDTNDVTCDGLTVKICKDNAWQVLSNCPEKCEDGECIHTDPIVEKCTEDAVQCHGDIKQMCVGETWLDIATCLYGCEEGACNEALIGTQCDESTWQETCINGGLHALVCENGVVVKNRCVDGNCQQDSDDSLRVDCRESCTADSKRECAPGCSADQLTGYYWNNTGSVVSFSCDATRLCTVVDGFASCGTDPCISGSTTRCIPTCSADKTKGYYNSRSISCPNGDCVYYKGSLYCGMPEACSRETYEPSCSASSEGTYCSADGVVKTWTCTGTQKCQLRQDGLCEGSAKCSSDKTYSITEYPKGFIDCVEDASSTIPETCEVGSDSICDEKGRAYYCGSNGRYYLKETCSSDQRCDHGQCIDKAIPETCTYGTSKAVCAGENNKELYICGEGKTVDGVKQSDYYYKKEVCSLSQDCTVDASTGWGQCINPDLIEECEPYSSRCSDNDLYACSVAKKYYLQTTCTDAHPCEEKVVNGVTTASCKGTLMPDGESFDCTPDVSKAKCIGENGQDLYVCGSNGKYYLSDSCQGDDVCRVYSSGFGQCIHKDVPESCEASESMCAGGALFKCTSKGWYLRSECADGKVCVENGTLTLARCQSPDEFGGCVYNTSPAYCDGQQVVVCGQDNWYYLRSTCGGNAVCTIDSNGFGKCDITELPDDVSGTCTQAKCSSDGNAYFCDKTTGEYYFDPMNGACSADKPCTVCSNGYGGCGITCLPSDIQGTCTQAKCSTVDGNAYFCNKTTGEYYFDATHGKCTTAKPCQVCSNGYAGCGITCNN